MTMGGPCPVGFNIRATPRHLFGLTGWVWRGEKLNMINAVFRTTVILLATASVTMTAANAGPFGISRSASGDVAKSETKTEVSTLATVISLLASAVNFTPAPAKSEPPAAPYAPNSTRPCEEDNQPLTNQSKAPAQKLSKTTVAPEPFYLGF